MTLTEERNVPSHSIWSEKGCHATEKNKHKPGA